MIVVNSCKPPCPVRASCQIAQILIDTVWIQITPCGFCTAILSILKI